MMNEPIWTVSSLLQSVKQTIDQNVVLKSFWLKGELSNFTAHHSGHWYFSIKDEGARIQCVMFQGYTREVEFKPKDGDKVLIRASVTVYPVQGQLQCTVFSMQNDGLGNLYIQFEKLKKKLFEAGLFDDAHKKRIPTYPERIGIISGKNTAALQDILKTFSNRWPMADLVIYETLVQGNFAARQIAQSLKIADEAQHDLLILARGGGSIEDLWAFNDELLALTIYHLKTPIITGIGHETDTTIADMVADLRAPTPTGAVQLAVRDYREVRAELIQSNRLLQQLMSRKLSENRIRIDRIKDTPSLTNPLILTQQHRLGLSLMSQSLINRGDIIKPMQRRLNLYQEDLKRLGREQIYQRHNQLKQADIQIRHAMAMNGKNKSSEFVNVLNLLNAYSPLNSLKRGYSLTLQDDQLIKSINDIDYDKNLEIRLSDGRIQAKPIHQGDQDHDKKTDI